MQTHLSAKQSARSILVILENVLRLSLPSKPNSTKAMRANYFANMVCMARLIPLLLCTSQRTPPPPPPHTHTHTHTHTQTQGQGGDLEKNLGEISNNAPAPGDASLRQNIT